MTTLDELFHRHAAASFDKQLYLGDLLGKLPWQFDLSSGVLSFGDRFKFPTQILGTESEGDQSWLWAWANRDSGIPDPHLRSARELQRLGKQDGIGEFTQPSLALETANGHVLAMIASGICSTAAYYRGPYEGGAVFLLIQAGAFERNIPSPGARIAFVFSELIMKFELDHRKAFLGYMEYYRMRVAGDDARMTAEAPNGERLTAEFDQMGRLIQIKGSTAGR